MKKHIMLYIIQYSYY
ncbi:hypothetical protein [Plasmodium yoelii yoelii]|uniref:Uncharacterized protein n=1 Tax=Plasmodium yoelii yoelii TaxID=73239 RepID=Q7RHY2_PLAYO|nr:hypothetical protein [Plasmodium yoelii yoelii]